MIEMLYVEVFMVLYQRLHLYPRNHHSSEADAAKDSLLSMPPFHSLPPQQPTQSVPLGDKDHLLS